MLNEKRGKGYDGYSMSVNARLAYADGEMPKTKWTKTAILLAIEEADLNVDLEKVAKLTAKELKDLALRATSWHHTSAKFNTTVFYSLDFDVIETLTNAKIDEIIKNRQPIVRRPKEVIEAEKQEKAERKAKREAEANRQEEAEALLPWSRYKTVRGLLNADEGYLNEIRKERAETIAKKRKALEASWSKKPHMADQLKKLKDSTCERMALGERNEKSKI